MKHCIISHSCSVNDRPTAISASYTTNEDTPLQITLVGEDGWGETAPLTYRLTVAPTHGRIASCSNCGGYPTGDLSSNTIFYIPNEHSVAADSFQFTVFDSEYESDPATVSISINPVNDPPTTNPVGPVDAREDIRTPITLSGQDVDEGDTLTVSICHWNGRGSLYLSDGTLIPLGASNVTVPSGIVEYLSPLNEFGNAFTSFTFRVTDSHGASSTCRAVSINVTPEPDAPVVPVQDTVIATEEEDTMVHLRATDPDNDELTFTICALPGKGTITQVGGAAIADGDTITDTSFFAPETTARLMFKSDDSSGNPYTIFGFRVSDGTLQSDCTEVTVIVTDVNDRPELIPLAPQTTSENVGISITLLATDSDSPVITFRIISPPSHGKLHDGNSATAPEVVVASPLSGDTVFFQPELNWFGQTSFTYVANDGELDSLQVTIVNE
jgi:hypothetical protein